MDAPGRSPSGPYLGVKYTRGGGSKYTKIQVYLTLEQIHKKTQRAVDLFCGPQIHKIHSEFSPTPNTQNTDLTPRLLMEPVSNPGCLIWQLGRGRPPGLSLVNQTIPT